MLSRVFERIDRALLAIAGVLVGSLFVVSCLQVLSRYLLQEPLVWAEEAARYLFVWATFIATAVLAASGEHYSMPELVDAMPPRIRRACAIMVRLLCVVFCGAMLWYGTKWAWRLRAADTPVLELSQGAVYAILPICAAYMALRLVLSAPGGATGDDK